MAQIQGHGGSCCGVRHLFGMDRTTVRQVEELIAQVDTLTNVGGPDSGRLIEVILSQRQVGAEGGGAGRHWAPCVEREGGWPVVMQRLGFRLVSRFNNANSGYDCFVFHRVPHFKSLQDLPFAWDFDGFRTPRPGGPGALRAPAVPEVALAHAWRVGDELTYIGRGVPPRTGQRCRVLRTVNERQLRIQWNDGTESTYSTTETAGPCFRAAPVEVPVTVVATFYANVLQRTGIGAFFPTLEAARAAAPRCRQQARIEISSDGTRRTVNL